MVHFPSSSLFVTVTCHNFSVMTFKNKNHEEKRKKVYRSKTDRVVKRAFLHPRSKQPEPNLHLNSIVRRVSMGRGVDLGWAYLQHNIAMAVGYFRFAKCFSSFFLFFYLKKVLRVDSFSDFNPLGEGIFL